MPVAAPVMQHTRALSVTPHPTPNGGT